MNDLSRMPDWNSWKEDESAVLCFIREEDKILLIHKKTGLGKGLINGPGGRIEAGETPVEAAARETKEEVGLDVSGLYEKGLLYFDFVDGYKLKGHVFLCDQYKGTPISTFEADPFWCKVAEIPYDKMWEDDSYWFPAVLDGKYIVGRFVFDGETMLARDVRFY